MRLLAFAASLRAGSLNRKLLRSVVDAARAAGAEVDHADFREFEMPLYDGDIEQASGLPPGALLLRDRIVASQGLLLATPEYNWSMPGTLKNAIDWVSRARPVPLKGKPVLVVTASTGPYGGSRSALAVRPPLEACGAFVYPSSYSLVKAGEAFEEGGELRDPAIRERVGKLVGEFVGFAQRLG
jgi:chromate reductase, NAD(P)H dehydrogenase (quinone)